MVQNLTEVIRPFYYDRNKRTLFIFSLTVAFLIPDVMLNWVAEFIGPPLTSLLSIVFFAVIVAVACLGAFFLLDFVKTQSKDLRSKDRFLRLIRLGVTSLQYALIGIIVYLLLEILLTRRYDTSLLVSAALVSEIEAVVLLAVFSHKFFSWYNLNRQTLVVLLYGLSFALNAFALAVVTAYDLTYLPQKEPEITPEAEVVFPNTLEPGSLLDILLSAYTYLLLASFGLLIIATAILLHHYSNRIGKVKFWIIVTLPLLYNISSTVETFHLYEPQSDAEWFNWSLFTSLNSTAGGILFGYAFWVIGNTVRGDSAVKQYLRFAMFGFIMLFISNQVSPSGASYPPYGVATMMFLPLSSFLVFLGLYSTAISISQDNQLRKSIRKIVTHDSNLLGSIGTAQMEQEIQKTVNSMKNVVQEQEKELEEQTGIEANLEEDEMKNYLEEVMQEVGKAKKPPS